MVQCICASRMLDKLGGGDGDEVINAMGDVSTSVKSLLSI